MSYDSTVLALSPLFYLKLDEDSGSLAADASGNDHAATLDTISAYQAAGLLEETHGGHAMTMGASSQIIQSDPGIFAAIKGNGVTFDCILKSTQSTNTGTLFYGFSDDGAIVSALMNFNDPTADASGYITISLSDNQANTYTKVFKVDTNITPWYADGHWRKITVQLRVNSDDTVVMRLFIDLIEILNVTSETGSVAYSEITNNTGGFWWLSSPAPTVFQCTVQRVVVWPFLLTEQQMVDVYCAGTKSIGGVAKLTFHIPFSDPTTITARSKSKGDALVEGDTIDRSDCLFSSGYYADKGSRDPTSQPTWDAARGATLFNNEAAGGDTYHIGLDLVAPGSPTEFRPAWSTLLVACSPSGPYTNNSSFLRLVTLKRGATDDYWGLYIGDGNTDPYPVPVGVFATASTLRRPDVANAKPPCVTICPSMGVVGLSGGMSGYPRGRVDDVNFIVDGWYGPMAAGTNISSANNPANGGGTICAATTGYDVPYMLLGSVAALDRPLTPTEITSFNAYIKALYRPTFAYGTRATLLIIGDSLSAHQQGLKLHGWQTKAPASILAKTLFRGDTRGGRQAAGYVTTAGYPCLADPSVVVGRSVALIWLGTNDISFGADSGATIYGYLVAIHDGIKATNPSTHVAICTVPEFPFLGDSGKTTRVQNLNALIRSDGGARGYTTIEIPVYGTDIHPQSEAEAQVIADAIFIDGGLSEMLVPSSRNFRLDRIERTDRVARDW